MSESSFISEFDNVFPFNTTELSKESYEELLPDFFEEVREDFTALVISSQKEDWLMVQRLAHKIKGTALSYSAVLIVEATLALQKELGSGDADQYQPLIDRLSKILDISYEYAKENFGIT